MNQRYEQGREDGYTNKMRASDDPSYIEGYNDGMTARLQEEHNNDHG